ncbi:MAG: hypothetical protein KF817_04345 [Phycisphaeraceae bacterium]|nr:hypothetical protein [Phycisphaeraceae bacterium]
MTPADDDRTPPPVDALTRLLTRLADLAVHDPDIRADLRDLAAWLTVITGEADRDDRGATAGAPPETGPRALPESGPPGDAPAADVRRPTVELPLRLGGVQVEVAIPASREARRLRGELEAGRNPSPRPAGSAAVSIDDSRDASPGAWWDRPIDPAPIARRARIKADACRWCIERRQRLLARADFDRDIRPQDEAIAARARGEAPCPLWMLDPWIQDRYPAGTWDALAGAFDLLAETADLAAERWPEPVPAATGRSAAAIDPGLPAFLEFAAEVQALLRTLVDDLARDADDVRDDPEQAMFFGWLRRMTKVRRVFVAKFMTRRDRVEADRLGALAGRLAVLRAETPPKPAGSPRRKQVLNTLRYEMARLRQVDGDRDAAHHWNRIDAQLEIWISSGLPVTDPDLLSVAESLLTHAGASGRRDTATGRVLAEASAARERRTAVADTDGAADQETRARTWSDDVLALRPSLRGRTVVIIGGEKRPESRRALEEAFELGELLWVEIGDAGSIALIEPVLRRADVALVLLLIRWCSHHITEQAPRVCREAGKPVVRVPAGYAPNAVARAIRDQAAILLGAAVE